MYESIYLEVFHKIGVPEKWEKTLKNTSEGGHLFIKILAQKNQTFHRYFLRIFFKDLFFNSNSLHARLNTHYKAWSYKKKKQKDSGIQEIGLERT